MKEHPPIAEHGLIGDLQTAALVATDGSIDWFCAPRFDSPSIFGAILDPERGGRFNIRPTTENVEVKQLYLPDTAILITRFLTEAGVGELVDFMPISSSTAATNTHRIARMIRCVRGELKFEGEISPRFDYGRRAHEVEVNEHGAMFTSGDMKVALHAVREAKDERLMQLRPSKNHDIAFSLSLKAGQVRGVVLETSPRGGPREIRSAEFQKLFDDTVQFWRSWLSQSTYTGRWREVLQRSAVTLKLMTYAPSGGLVAAPTASLPEQLGGERNWDYRFTWVRDSSFSVYALLGMGFVNEAAAFADWLRQRVSENAPGACGPLNVMYRVDGSSDLTEETLDHWRGYRNSAPVRIGNGAADQLQLDIYGEALDSIYFCDQRGVPLGHQGWTRICDMLDWLVDNWDQPEEGIWETRGGRKDFTYGRLMSWVAFDRAIRLAAAHGRPGPVERWRNERDSIYRQVMTRGWNQERQAFVQHYGDKVLDSSNLRMGTVGFIAPHDPMWLSTLKAMDEELVTDSLVYRYDPAATPDGLRGDEGTFSLCTFTYVDALARAGRLEDARLVFEKMLTYANHLGLYSEEIALTGEQIGNFPQAFTHLSLIDAAITLDDQLNRNMRKTTVSALGS
jgi:pentatricopeptide repeat protein